MSSVDRDIMFRPMVETDVPMLHAWLQRPHVSEWWGGDGASSHLEDTRRKYLPRLNDSSSIQGHFAMLDAEPIGFIQSYVAMDCGDGWWADETDPGVRGIDQFLGDGSMLGQGLGTRMVMAFVQRLFADPRVTRVQADPDPANSRAIRCYEKAGFRRVGTIVTPDGPALLMATERGGMRVA